MNICKKALEFYHLLYVDPPHLFHLFLNPPRCSYRRQPLPPRRPERRRPITCPTATPTPGSHRGRLGPGPACAQPTAGERPQPTGLTRRDRLPSRAASHGEATSECQLPCWAASRRGRRTRRGRDGAVATTPAARADDDGGGDSEATAVLPAEAGAGVWRAHPAPAAAGCSGPGVHSCALASEVATSTDAPPVLEPRATPPPSASSSRGGTRAAAAVLSPPC